MSVKPSFWNIRIKHVLDLRDTAIDLVFRDFRKQINKKLGKFFLSFRLPSWNKDFGQSYKNLYEMCQYNNPEMEESRSCYVTAMSVIQSMIDALDQNNSAYVELVLELVLLELLEIELQKAAEQPLYSNNSEIITLDDD